MPFLNGYSIASRSITPTGKYTSGYEDFKVLYELKKGEEKKAQVVFYATVIAYNADVVSDEIYFQYVVCEIFVDDDGFTYWEEISNSSGKGLASRLK